MMIFRNRLLATTAAGVISLGVLGGGVYALNQNGDGPTPASAQQPGPTATPTDTSGRHHLKREFKASIDEILKAAGLTRDLVRQGLKDGKSFNQIITDNHGNPADVQNKVLAIVTARINDAAKNGKLTQDQANKILDKLKVELPKLMDHAHKAPNGTKPNGTNKPGGHSFSAVGKAGEIDAAAAAINISKAQLLQELMGGSKSIADVAKAHNVDVGKVIDAMVADATKRVDDAVTAGKLDAAKAAEVKSHLKDMVTKVVNLTMPGPHGHKPGRPAKPATTS